MVKPEQLNGRVVKLTDEEIIVIILALDKIKNKLYTRHQNDTVSSLLSGKFEKLGREIDFIGDYNGA